MTIHLVCEDALSEIVMKRLVAETFAERIEFITLEKRGKGYIKQKIDNFNKINNDLVFFILVDLDLEACPPLVIKNFFNRPCRSNLIFRVAVREMEAWLLADTEGFARFVKLEKDYISREIGFVESIDFPKEKLIFLVNKSKDRELKRDIVRFESNTFRQGPAYNARLYEYVGVFWDIGRARKNADSLDTAMEALKKLKGK